MIRGCRRAIWIVMVVIIFVVVSVIIGVAAVAIAHSAGVGTGSGWVLVENANLPNKLVEGVFDIHALFRTCFQEFAVTELAGQ